MDNQPIKEAKPPKSSGLKVCVFCSASDIADSYQRAAKELARLLAEHGHSLVFGGSNMGLMKIMADGMKAGGAKVVGISVDFLKNAARQDIDELIIAKNLGERKALMLERADALVVLPGGTGTLDELTEVIELKKHNHHNKEILVLNTAGFYDGLKTLLERMHKDGFLKHELDYYIRFYSEPAQLVGYLSNISPNR